MATDLLLESYDTERLGATAGPDHGPVEDLFSLDATLPPGVDDSVLAFLASLPGCQRHLAHRTASLELEYRASPAVGGYHGHEGSAISRHPSAASTRATWHRMHRSRRIRASGSATAAPTSRCCSRASPTPRPRGCSPEMPLPGFLPVRSVIVTRTRGVRSAHSGTSIVTDSGGGIHHAWGIVSPTHVLVRPDGYVAWRAVPPDPAALSTFLARLHGSHGPSRPPAADSVRAERLAG